MGWGECQGEGGVQHTGCILSTDRGPWLEAGSWDGNTRLESGSLQGVWGRCSCYSLDLSVPAQEGGQQEDFPECQAASFRPTPAKGKGAVTRNYNAWNFGKVEPGRKKSVEEG